MKRIRNVLVIDDSKLARLTLSRLLKAEGLSVAEAESVKEGIATLRSEAIDAAFIDVQMPEQDGFEALKIIKADPELKNLPCSMYSGDLSMDAQQAAVENGAQAYLFKPATAEGVAHVLKALQDNIIADDMASFAPAETPDLKISGIRHAQQKHKQALVTLDKRTRNLARVINYGQKDTEAAVESLFEQLAQSKAELEALKNSTQHLTEDEATIQRLENTLSALQETTRQQVEEEDLTIRRIENDLRSQLNKANDNLRKATKVALGAAVVAIIALIVAIF